MKLIIDIPKRVYDATKTMGNVIDADNKIVAEAIINGIPIRDYDVECRNHYKMLLNAQKVRHE